MHYHRPGPEYARGDPRGPPLSRIMGEDSKSDPIVHDGRGDEKDKGVLGRHVDKKEGRILKKREDDYTFKLNKGKRRKQRLCVLEKQITNKLSDWFYTCRMKVLLCVAVFVGTLIVVSATETKTKDIPQEDNNSTSSSPSSSSHLDRWRMAVQEILTSISAGPLSTEFTPSHLAKRRVADAMKNQVARLRGQVASAMLETVGSRVDLCAERRFSDEAVAMVKEELEARGFKVEWTAQAERKQEHRRWCYRERESMVVHIPPADPSMEPEQQK